MTEDKTKKRLSDEIIAALIGAVGGIIVALIGVGFFPFLNPDVQALKERNAELQAQLAQTIPAPQNSDTWTDQNGNRHRYWVCQSFPDWEKAKTFCESLGGHLATITSAEEQAHIQDYVKKNATKTLIWIGIQPNNGNWNQWITGESFSYTNWHEWYPGTRSADNYSVLCNDPDFIFHVVKPDGTLVSSSKVNMGEWVLFSEDEKVRNNYNSDGWLICEWDYD